MSQRSPEYQAERLKRVYRRKEARKNARLAKIRRYGRQSDDHTCNLCGGEMTWCSSCEVWSSTCCCEYGTCQCS